MQHVCVCVCVTSPTGHAHVVLSSLAFAVLGTVRGQVPSRSHLVGRWAPRTYVLGADRPTRCDLLGTYREQCPVKRTLTYT